MRKKQEDVVGDFVAYWGDVAEHWGIDPASARVLSFLYVMEDPYNISELCGELGLTRPKVKRAVEQLAEWECIEIVEVEGLKGDYFLCAFEAWEVVWRVTAARGREEIAQALPLMDGLIERAGGDPRLGNYETARLREAVRFTHLVERGLRDFQNLPHLHLASVTQLGGRVAKMFGLGGS